MGSLDALIQKYGTTGLDWRSSPSLENPQTGFDRAFELLAVNNRSYSGQMVSEQSALTISAVFACVRVIANGVAMLDLCPYRETDKTKEVARDHYLYPLLKKQANPGMSAFRFKRLMTTWACLWGNAYAYVDIRRNGRVVGLYPFHPARTRVEVGRKDSDYKLFYTFLDKDGNVIHDKLSEHEVLHFRGLETDEMGMGITPVSVARNAIGNSQAIEEYTGSLFQNGLSLSGVLSHPNRLSDQAAERIRQKMQHRHGAGGSSRGGLLVLEEGMKFDSTQMHPEDAQFLETRQYQVSDICRWFGVPNHMVNDLSHATFSNIEHQGLEFVTHTLGPWLENWEQEINNALLSVTESQTISVEFDRDELTMGDMKSRADAFSVLRNNGILTGNEVREEFGFNPTDEGDVLLVNGNMVPVEQAGEAQEMAEGPENPPDAKPKSGGENGDGEE